MAYNQKHSGSPSATIPDLQKIVVNPTSLVLAITSAFEMMRKFWADSTEQKLALFECEANAVRKVMKSSLNGVPSERICAQLDLTLQKFAEKPRKDKSSFEESFSQAQGELPIIFARRGPASAKPAASRSSNAWRSSDPCFNWNSLNGCGRGVCKFRHVCSLCRRSGHNRFGCPMAPSPFNSNAPTMQPIRPPMPTLIPPRPMKQPPRR